jgi:hypothetical protein
MMNLQSTIHYNHMNALQNPGMSKQHVQGWFDFSVIFLVDDAHSELPGFVNNIYDLFIQKGMTFEIIILMNGIEGLSSDFLNEFDVDKSKVKVFFMNKKSPQSTCIRAGVRQSKGDVILACGSYPQISIHDIETLLDAFDSDTDLITPWRQRRIDPGINQLQSKLFNWIVKKTSGVNIHDLSCTVKVFRREVVEQIPLYGNMYRFLPLVAFRRGYRIKEIPCSHLQEFGKTGIYSLPEYFGRIIDIFALLFIMGYTRKPLRFFSFIGACVFSVGLFFFVVVIWQKILLGYPVGDRPLLLLGIIVMVLGVQIWSSGLLGEIIAFTYGRFHREYWIEDTTEEHQ